MNRRAFVALTVGTLSACAERNEPTRSASEGRWVKAGLVKAFAADGVYGATRDDGFFVIREGEQLYAMSAICTHRTCKLRTKPDHSFFCPCHGSRFDSAGHVTHGPATRDLPRLRTSADASGHLLVWVPGS